MKPDDEGQMDDEMVQCKVAREGLSLRHKGKSLRCGASLELPRAMFDRYEAAGLVEFAGDEADESTQCIALTKSGEQCRRTAPAGSDRCSTHQPDEG